MCKWRAYSGIKSPIPSDCCLLTYSSLVYIFLRVNSAIRSLADKKLIGSGWAALKTIDRKVDVISTREEVFLLNSIFLPIAPAQDFALSFLNTLTAPRLYTHSLIITHIPTQKIHAGWHLIQQWKERRFPIRFNEEEPQRYQTENTMRAAECVSPTPLASHCQSRERERCKFANTSSLICAPRGYFATAKSVNLSRLGHFGCAGISLEVPFPQRKQTQFQL